MLGPLIEIFAYVYIYTWFVWPFAFVFGLAHGIKELIKTEKIDNKGFYIASIALLIILAGVVYSSFK